MNKQIEALKMAIEALSQDEGWFEPEAAIKACKEALEQELPEDAELESYKQGYEQGKFDALMDAELTKSEYKFDHPDYGELTQIPEQPAQEPVEVIASGTSTWGNVKPSWQGLSDDEIGMYWDRVIADDEDSSEFTQIRFARAIEQALKEKNHEQTN